MKSTISINVDRRVENHTQFNINNHEHQKSARLLPGLQRSR